MALATFVKNSTDEVFLTHGDSVYELIAPEDLEGHAQYQAWVLANGEPELLEDLDDAEGTVVTLEAPAE